MKFDVKKTYEFLSYANKILDDDFKLYLTLDKYQFIVDFFITSINNIEEVSDDTFENIMQALKIVDRQSYNFLRGKLMSPKNSITRSYNHRPTPIVKARLVIDDKEYNLMIKKQDLLVLGNLSDFDLYQPIYLPQLYLYLKNNNIGEINVDEVSPLYEELLENLKLRDILLKIIILNTREKFNTNLDSNKFLKIFKTNIVNIDSKLDKLETDYFNSNSNNQLLERSIKLKTKGNCN